MSSTTYREDEPLDRVREVGAVAQLGRRHRGGIEQWSLQRHPQLGLAHVAELLDAGVDEVLSICTVFACRGRARLGRLRGNGFGVVHDNGTGKETYMSMKEFGLGIGLGLHYWVASVGIDISALAGEDYELAGIVLEGRIYSSLSLPVVAKWTAVVIGIVLVSAGVYLTQARTTAQREEGSAEKVAGEAPD